MAHRIILQIASKHQGYRSRIIEYLESSLCSYGTWNVRICHLHKKYMYIGINVGHTERVGSLGQVSHAVFHVECRAGK